MAKLLTKTLERYVCEEVTEGDFNNNKLSDPSQDKPSQKTGKSSLLSEQMDVDALVNDLLSDAKEHGKGNQHEVHKSIGDFLKTAQNCEKSHARQHVSVLRALPLPLEKVFD